VLSAAIDAGITPWLTLHHFSLPRWFAADGAFLDPAGRTGPWTRHVERMAETFGDLAGGWQPINEVNYYARASYGGGRFPPNHHDAAEQAAVDEAIQLANAEAAVRLRQTGAPVASILGLTDAVALDDDPATAAGVQQWHDELWNPALGLFRDGVLRVPGREPVDRPDLVGAFDLIGFSYYTCMGFERGRLVVHPADAPVSPLGYGIWADGLRVVLDHLHAELRGTPLLVAEYGIGTDDDDERADYLRRGLEVVHEAIADGIDVRGFFHWTAVDNYEWHHGYDPAAAFGIIDRDRRVRASARVLRREARSA
jgi:beta-glucosidase